MNSIIKGHPIEVEIKKIAGNTCDFLDDEDFDFDGVGHDASDICAVGIEAGRIEFARELLALLVETPLPWWRESNG